MKNQTMLILLALSIATQVEAAEVFKCSIPGQKTVYQPVPCAADDGQEQLLEIKELPPEKIKEAEERLEAWKAKLANKEAAEQKAKKEQEALKAQEETAKAINRDAKANENLAKAVKRPTVIINETPVFVHPRPLRRPLPGLLPDTQQGRPHLRRPVQ